MPAVLTEIPFEVKAAKEAEGKRLVSGLASTWSIDLGNDRIRMGAFKRTLNSWKSAKREKPIPFLDQHRYDSVTRIIGKLTQATETPDGLEVTFEMASHQHALDIFSLIQAGMVTGLSIGYEAVKWDIEKQEGKPDWDAIRNITELKLFEISAVMWPMNPEARIEATTVKSLIEQSKSRDLTSAELQQLKDLAIDINALLTKNTPASDAPPAGSSADSGLATPEQIAAVHIAATMLKLRRPAIRDGSAPARAVDLNPRTEDHTNVTTREEAGKV